MGQKTNPIGFRLAVNKDWRSKWFASRKEFLGDPVIPLSADLFPKVRAILYASSALMALGTAGVLRWW